MANLIAYHVAHIRRTILSGPLPLADMHKYKKRKKHSR